jgi:hypothetical protein
MRLHAARGGTFSCSSSPVSSATFYAVAWISGVTEGGSSGTTTADNGNYVIGQLYGGSSSCAAPATGDFYGRFDNAYAVGLNQWLAPQPMTLTVTVTKQGAANGSVSSSPAGISCGHGGTCSAPFANAAMVTLTATPDAGSSFTGWSGACSGLAACVVTMSTAQAVTAAFNDTLTATLAAPVAHPGFQRRRQVLTCCSARPTAATTCGSSTARPCSTA